MNNKLKIITLWIIYNENKEILLWKRSSNEKVFPWYWSIPWWMLEIKVNSPKFNILENNLKKTIQQNLWIDVEITEYINSHYGFYQDEFNIYIWFLAKHTNWSPKQDFEEIKYFNINEIPHLDLPPNILELINIWYEQI